MVSRRSLAIQPFLVMDVLDRAQGLERNGKRVIHMEVGEPDFDTPEPVKEAAIRALKEGKTHYTHSMGLVELREAISEHYWNDYHVRTSPDQILITSGSSPAMQLVFSALLEAGDEVVLSDPGYSCYANMISFYDGVPLPVEVLEGEGFQYSPDAVGRKTSAKTRGIVINSPANPTGMLLAPDRIRKIAELGCFVLSDEIYHGLTYNDQAHSALEFTDRAFVFNGFSKLYAMTGWRLGYVIAPREFVRPMQKIQQNFFISPNAFVQWAGVAALRATAAEVAFMVRMYDQRRRFIIQGLRRLGFGIPTEPDGAFYVFANARRFGADSLKLAMDILDSVHVGVAPGVDFGANGEGYLRFCYANSLENIEEGLARLGRFFEIRRQGSAYGN